MLLNLIYFLLHLIPVCAAFILKYFSLFFVKIKNHNIIYLHNINSKNLFSIIEYSKVALCPHGLMTHLCRFHKKKSLNLFNFIINNKDDVTHQKISFSEWYKDKKIKFIFLNTDMQKTLRKIMKNI